MTQTNQFSMLSWGHLMGYHLGGLTHMKPIHFDLHKPKCFTIHHVTFMYIISQP